MRKKQNQTDSELILQYLEGDTSVLAVLVKRYHKDFCQKAYWVTKDRDLAKDIAQESWITIIGKLTSLQDRNSFKSWANRIVYTKAIDSIKNKIKEDQKRSEPNPTTTEKETTEEQRSRIKITLLKAIQQLPKGKQDIIRLFYTEEYSIKEIGLFLSIPTGTVKSRLFKAREKLKSILKTHTDEK